MHNSLLYYILSPTKMHGISHIKIMTSVIKNCTFLFYTRNKTGIFTHCNFHNIKIIVQLMTEVFRICPSLVLRLPRTKGHLIKLEITQNSNTVIHYTHFPSITTYFV
jgi:hypothetical protein